MSREIPARVAQRAYENCDADEHGCLISRYSTGSHGYAQIGWWENGKTVTTTAHRAAWVHENGQVPDGMDIDHRPTCSRRCVNTHHLRPLPATENRRRHGKDWPIGTCARGHPESARYRQPSGKTRCRMCKAEEGRDYRARKRAAHERPAA